VAELISPAPTIELVEAGPPITGQHSAVLVPDLDAAIAEFTTSTATVFGAPMAVPMTIFNDSHSESYTVRFAYSADMTLELVEMVDGSTGPFAPAVGRGFHHFGRIATMSLDEAVSAQRELGAEVEWRLAINGAPAAVFFGPTSTRPVRFELLSPTILALI
jgi:hypothetical protein